MMPARLSAADCCGENADHERPCIIPQRAWQQEFTPACGFPLREIEDGGSRRRTRHGIWEAGDSPAADRCRTCANRRRLSRAKLLSGLHQSDGVLRQTKWPAILVP